MHTKWNLLHFSILSIILFRHLFIQKKVNTESQTKKNKYSRWENVGQVFELTNKKQLNNKHILLVDDVVTTGSTLESCIDTLQQTEGIKVSIVTIAIA